MKRFLLFLTLTLCVNLHTKAQVSQAERDALIDLFNATNGSEWTNNTNWLSSSEPVSSWYGVTVENNMVTEVSLYNNNLEGEEASQIPLLIFLMLVHCILLTINLMEICQISASCLISFFCISIITIMTF